MALLFGFRGGASVVAAEPALSEYDPVYQEEVATPLFWKLLDDYYNLSADRDVIEAYWAGMVQEGSNELVRAYTYDATTSLRSTPILSQRRWVSFDLTQKVDFLADPVLTYDGAPSFSWDENYVAGDSTGALVGSWQNRVDADRAFAALRGPLTERASLRWSFRLQFVDIQRGAFATVGYSSTREQSTSALLAGIARKPGESENSATLVLVHIGAEGELVLEGSNVVLLPDTDYRLDASWVASSQTMTLDAYEMRGLKYTSATASTGDYTQQLPFVNILRVEGADLAGEGIVAGDVVIYGGQESEITAVAGDLLTVRSYIFPADARDLPIEVRGAVLVGGITLPVGARTGDYTHTVDKFGATTLDFSRITDEVYTNPYVYLRATATGATWGWVFADPTSSQQVAELPSLQDKIRRPTLTWAEGVDFHLTRHPAGTTFEFPALPSDRVWAEFVAYDERLLSDIYGENVGIVGDSSQDYRTRLRGLYFAYFRGPRRASIRTGVHLLLGLPAADEAGVVEELEETFTGLLGRIRVSGRDYTYPRSVGTTLQVGDVVRAFQPLCNGVELSDWKTDPLWWTRHNGLTELQKYHAFGVLADVSAISLADLVFALSFLGNLKPTWKRAYVTLVSATEDTVQVEDEVALDLDLNLWDVPGDVLVPRYDSYDYNPDVTDWRYDQVEGDEWAVTAGIQRLPRRTGVTSYLYLLNGAFTLTNGSTTGTGTGSLSVNPGLGPATRKYVAVSQLFAGTAGATVAGGSVLTDATSGAFTDVLPGGLLVLGAAFYRIAAVTEHTLTVEGEFPSTATGLAWEVLNEAFLRGKIASVTSDDELEFAEPFTGTTGVYVLALIDLRVMNVYYDQQDEQSPEEELEFEALLSHGYGLDFLSSQVLHFVEGSNTVTGGSAFVTEFGPVGPISGRYLMDPRGRWYAVLEVFSNNGLRIHTGAVEGFAMNAHGWASPPALTGAFAFTNGSPTVVATDAQTGIVAAGDWLQVVSVTPAAGVDPYLDSPVVRVLSIDMAGLVITLDENYTGRSEAGAVVVRRGADADLFPLTQDLPDGRGPSDVVSQNFTAFREAAGATMTSTVVEPTVP